MSDKICDHTSVGILVWNNEKLLLIERKKPPFGFAPPAGHVDAHGDYDAAAKNELEEEVGLKAYKMKLLTEGRKKNPCRRQDGTWHFWKIYEAKTEGELNRSLEETKSAKWYSLSEVKALAMKTEEYQAGKISDEDWNVSPGIEPVWYEWLKELKIL